MNNIDGWITSKVVDTASKMKAGGTPSRSNSYYWRGNIPFVLIEDMTKTERFLFETKENISSLGLQSSSTWIVPENSILLSMYATLGKVVINKIPVATNQAILGIIPGKVDRDFLFYLLQFSADRLSKLNSQTTQKNLNKQIVSDFEITYPSDPTEQRAIADILSSLDEAIAQSESLVRKYKSIKQGLRSDLLTRGVDENGDIRNPEEFVESPIGNYPNEWTITSLGDLILKNDGFIQTGPFGSQLHSYEYVEQGIPVVMPQDITENGKISEENIARITSKKAKELSRHIVKPNDVVFARRGDLSRSSAIAEHETGWLCGTGSMLMRPPKKEIDGRWLAAVYSHEIGQHQIRARAVGSTMVNLNSTLLKDLVIPKPLIHEQAVIMEIIESQDNLLNTEVDNLTKLGLLKQGLMQDLLSGQVRVSSLHD